MKLHLNTPKACGTTCCKWWGTASNVTYLRLLAFGGGALYCQVSEQGFFVQKLSLTFVVSADWRPWLSVKMSMRVEFSWKPK